MTKKTDLHCLQDIPNIEALSEHFIFIEDLILRKNIAIVFQYIIFLISLEKNHILPGAVSYTIYKDMIIHTASITESLLCYGLIKGIEKGKTTLSVIKILEDKYKNFKEVYIMPTSEKVGAVIQTKKLKNPQDAQFNDLIPAAVRVGLINETLKEKLDLIRQARNRVHLSSLSRVDDMYTMKEVDNMFATVKKLKTSIILYLH